MLLFIGHYLFIIYIFVIIIMMIIIILILSRCFYPKYCPEGTEVPFACPLGYKAVNHNDLRSDYAGSCRICPAGTYGNHTERFYCADCPEGYYCPEGKEIWIAGWII